MTASLMQIAIQLTRAILPVDICIGVVGNSLNIVVLTRPIFYHHSCSLYFLALSCNNLFYSSVILVYRLLMVGYQLYPNNSSIGLCKFIQYINDVCPSMSPHFIVLASIDRYCASSANTQLRKLSSTFVARWTIIILVVLFMLFFISTLVLTELRQNDGLGCRIRSDSVYSQVYVIIQALLLAVIAPCLMTLFGLMTIFNIKRLRVISIVLSRQRRTENQLVRMVLLQAGVHVGLTMPMCITYLMLLLPTKYQTKPGFYAVYAICYLPFYLSYTIAFAVYVLSSRMYRTALVRQVRKIVRFCRSTPIHPTNINAVPLPSALACAYRQRQVFEQNRLAIHPVS